MNRRIHFITLLIATAPLFAKGIEDRVVDHTLKNGLRILVVERRVAPVVSLTIRFKAGSVDEQVGATGIAHMLEHMLFKGTQTIGTRDYNKEKPILDAINLASVAMDEEEMKGEKSDKEKLKKLTEELKKLREQHEKVIIKDELEELYNRTGAVGFNASTNTDMTTYIVSLPANKVELWMRLESDRMRSPVLREFYKERSVILEERRTRTDDRPFGRLYENFKAAAFMTHPYRNPVIGWRSDIERLTVRQAESFRKTFYAPNNVVMAIVGDVKAQKIIKQIEKHFGDIQPQQLPPSLSTKEPAQQGERRIKVQFDASPQMLIGFHKPNAPHPDDYVIDVIANLLSEGRTSRFHKELIEGKELAISAWASNSWPGDRYDNLFVVSGTPRHPHTIAEVEAAVYEELDRLKKEPVPESELVKIRNNVESSFIWGLGSNSGLARRLTYFVTIMGDWNYLVDYPQRIASITPADIQRVAKAYFSASNRTVAILVRPEKGTKKK